MSADNVGGVWTYATELRAGLAAAGVDVVLATIGPSPPPEQEDRLWLDRRLEWQDDPWDDVEVTGYWLRDLAATVGADVVHLNGYAHAALRWPVPVVAVAHSCVLSWHAAVRGHEAGPEWERYRESVAAGLRGADAIVAPTIAMRRALRRHHDCDRACRVIPNGVSPHLAAAAPREQLVLGAGRLWDEAKGLDTLAEVAGAADGREARHARLLGQLGREQLRAQMGRAEIFAHPARYEPFGLAVLEAALAGCALVLGDIESLREQWEGVAMFVPPGDSAALRAALERLIADGDLRRTLGRSAQERARRRTCRAMADEYLALYTQLRSRPRVSA